VHLLAKIFELIKMHGKKQLKKANFLFTLLCVSLADVDFWVDGGWDQPTCGITLNLDFIPLFLQNLNLTGKIRNFLIIYTSIIVLKILKQF
jgi:hypothetical protein